METTRDSLVRLLARDARACWLAFAAFGLPALVVIPLGGIEPGFQVALKLAALGIAAVVFARRPAARAKTTSVERCLAALAITAVLPTMLPGVAAGAVTASLPVAATFVAAAAIVRGARSGLARRWTAVHAVVLGVTTIVAAIAFAELVGARLPWAWARRPESTLGNRNQLAGFLAMTLPFVFVAATRWRRALPFVTLVVLVLVATRCRSAYLAATAACALAAVGMWLHRRRGGRAVTRDAAPPLVAGIAGAAGAFLPWPGVRFAAPVSDAASRLFEHDRGTGLERILQHRAGIAALGAEPLAWITGLGGGSWERVTSGFAHDASSHAPRFTGAVTPNSEILRTAVEQGALGMVLLVGVVAWTMRALVRGVGRGATSSSRVAGMGMLGAASVTAFFDPILIRPECVGLVALVAGLASGDPGGAEVEARRSPAPPIVRLAAAAAAFVLVLRAASFAASSRLGSDPVASPGWDARQATAMRLFPRPSLDEKRAAAWADVGRCDDAAAALARFVAVRPHHWGARARVARCFDGRGDHAASRTLWRTAFDAEPHLRALLLGADAEPDPAGLQAHLTSLEPRNPR